MKIEMNETAGITISLVAFFSLICSIIWASALVRIYG